MPDTIISKNLLKIDGSIFNAIKYSATNATIKQMSDIGAQALSLYSSVQTDGFLIYANGSGELGVASPLFAVDATESFKVSGIFTIGSLLAGKTLRIKVEYFSVSSGSVGTAMDYVGEREVSGQWTATDETHQYKFVTPDTATTENPVSVPMTMELYPYGYRNPEVPNVASAIRFWIPTGANYARVSYFVESATAGGQGFLLTDISAIKTSGILNNPTINTTYRLLPEFIRHADEKSSTRRANEQKLVTKKYLASAFAYGITIGEDLRDWVYIRAEDTNTGVEKTSKLTDPLIAKKEHLSWLAQTVGVTLINPYTGLSMWISLQGWDTDLDSTTWQQIDLIDGESGDDSCTWVAARSSVYEDIDSYRNQIKYAFNGLNAGQPAAMRSYLGTILDTKTPASYFYRIKTPDRESPHLVKYIFDPDVDPDPAGTRVELEMAPTLSSGVFGSQSSRPADAGEFAYEPKVFLEKNVPGSAVSADDKTVFRFGSNAAPAIPDQTGSGRHLCLVNSGISDPKASQYGVIAGARYNRGFGFYPSSVTGSGAHISLPALNTGLSGTTVDYIFHVSDISYGNSADTVLFEQGTSGNANYRACVVDETGVLKYLTGASGSAASTAYAAASDPVEYDFTTVGDRWIRISVTASTTKFYVGPSMIDVCHPTTYLINSVSLASPNVYDNSLASVFFKVAHNGNGIVGYRGIVNDGALDSQYSGFLLSSVADLNLTTYTGTTGTSASVITELYDGIDDFDQDSTLNKDANTCQFNITYEASPVPLSNWIGLPHTGTDYLYLGNQSSAGDSLVVSGMDSDSYNWTATYTDGTTATGSGTATTFTWTAATYGGKQIKSIAVVGTKTYTFLPSVITTHTITTSTGTDSASGTWTINRAWESSDDYEFSSIVDRDLIQTNREGAGLAPNLGVGLADDISFSLHYRRFKTDSGNDNWVFKHNNVQLKFTGSGVTCYVNDKYDSSDTARNTSSVTWNDTSRIGQWNHIGFVRDVSGGKIYLYANGTLVANAADTTLSGLSTQTGTPASNIVFHTDNEPGWQFNHMALFKEALSVADMERVRQTLPT